MNTLSPLTAPTMPSGVAHGFFTRQGGISHGIYDSLNVGRGSQDDPTHIAENRARICQHLQAHTLITGHQTHSTAVAIITTPQSKSSQSESPQADALITRERGLALGALSADCVPILLACVHATWVASIHAGWRGAHDGIIETTLATLDDMGVQRHDIIAAIGPAISASAYEVGADFAANFQKTYADCGDLFSPLSSAFAAPNDDHCFFDLPAFVARRLHKGGVVSHNQNLCTYGRPDLFFSYRRSCHNDSPDYGRQISAICIK